MLLKWKCFRYAWWCCCLWLAVTKRDAQIFLQLKFFWITSQFEFYQNNNLIKNIGGPLQNYKGPEIFTWGPGCFTVPSTYKLHFNPCTEPTVLSAEVTPDSKHTQSLEWRLLNDDLVVRIQAQHSLWEIYNQNDV